MKWGLIELFEKNDTANPMIKAPIKLTKTVPKGMFSKTLLNLRLMPQRSQAQSTEPKAIDRREKYIDGGAPNKSRAHTYALYLERELRRHHQPELAVCRRRNTISL